MSIMVYLLERQKFIWDRTKNDWIANQMSSAWSSAVFRDYTKARSKARSDFDYMFKGEPDCARFEKVSVVESINEETIVGRIVYTYRCCGEDYKIIYRITKKELI